MARHERKDFSPSAIQPAMNSTRDLSNLNIVEVLRLMYVSQIPLSATFAYRADGKVVLEWDSKHVIMIEGNPV
jgi:hypothetical protein